MRRGRVHTGFTMIEILVVIGIIGVLIAMLVPAVQRVRDSAARLQSMNHLKQIVLAAHNFNDAYNYLPPSLHYRERYEYHSSTGLTTFTQWEESFFVSILPFIEHGTLFQAGHKTDLSVPGFTYNYTDLAAMQVPVPVYLNPSDPSSDGFPDGASPGWWYANTATVGYLVNAMAVPWYFHYRYVYDDNVAPDVYQFYGPKCGLARSFPDGTSNTILLAESYGKWAYAYDPTTYYYNDFTYGYRTYFNFEDNGSVVFDLVENNPLMNNCIGQGPKAPRRSGLLVGLCDGSVRNVSPPVYNGPTWQNACGRADGRALGADWVE